ncbi:MAG: hypothetical protein RLY16_2250 [Bacteroidota bacterium]|jgi:hypothetical protein
MPHELNELQLIVSAQIIQGITNGSRLITEG